MLIQSLDSFLAKQPAAHRAHADAFFFAFSAISDMANQDGSMLPGKITRNNVDQMPRQIDAFQAYVLNLDVYRTTTVFGAYK